METVSSLPKEKGIIGIKEIEKNIKNGNIKEVIVASNCPEELIKKLEGVSIKQFDGNEQELATKLGKPFPIAMVGFLKIMKIKLDEAAIKSMGFFQKLTGSTVMDSLSEEDEMYFVVGKGQYGLSVGKNGEKIKKAEKLFKKSIKIIEYSEDLKEFVKNLIPEAQEVEVEDKTVLVKVNYWERSKVIGKQRKKINVAAKFLQRLFDIENIKLK